MPHEEHFRLSAPFCVSPPEGRSLLYSSLMARRTVGGGVKNFFVFGLGCILICGVQYVMWLRYYLMYVFLSKLGFKCVLAVHLLMG